jgi:dUTP pyrophosphatase
LSTNAYIPKRLTKWSAGLDLQSAYDYQLLPHNKCYIKTDLIICCPKGTYGRIAPKSSLAHKYHIDVGAGVIDEDYRGNILVLLFNHSDYPIFIQKGDLVAQIIFEKIMYPNVKIVTSLNETNRADRGLGITHTNLI